MHYKAHEKNRVGWISAAPSTGGALSGVWRKLIHPTHFVLSMVKGF